MKGRGKIHLALESYAFSLLIEARIDTLYHWRDGESPVPFISLWVSNGNRNSIPLLSYVCLSLDPFQPLYLAFFANVVQRLHGG